MKQIVYILSGGWHYEGADPMRVYASKSVAVSVKKRLERQKEAEVGVGHRLYRDYYVVNEIELHGAEVAA